MKASTLLAVTVALFLALGTAIGARALGLFAPGPGAAPPPPVIKILVAKTSLYAEQAINPDRVRVRDLRPDEVEFYNKNRDKFLPASVEAAALRIPTRNIEADSPILRSDLEDLAFPDGVGARLKKGMVAVNVAIPKERSAGGLITKGDRVDVLLTSLVCDGQDCSKAATLSAYIARNLRVIVKRNSLWTTLRPNPNDMPVDYTLEANPYRAALIGFATGKGRVILVPSAAPRGNGIVPVSTDGPRTINMADSREYRDEDERVDRILKGEMSITDGDLERIFNLRPIVRRPPPAPPILIQRISGNNVIGHNVFSPEGRYLGAAKLGKEPSTAPPPPESSGPLVAGATPSMGYVFHSPDSSLPSSPTAKKPGDPGYCPECEAARKQR